MSKHVAIVGVGQTAYRGHHDQLSTPELAQEAVRAALAPLEMKASEIDAVVFGIGPEAFEGVNNTDKWLVDAVGMAGKPTMRVNTGGTTGAAAALAGIDLIASGEAEVVLVVALQMVGQSPHAQRILSTIWDPIYEQEFSLSPVVLAALRSVRSMKLHGITEEHWAEVSVRNHRWGRSNPLAHLQIDVSKQDVLDSPVIAWPMKRLDTCPRSEGACAVVLASESAAKRFTRRPAWFHGVGSSTDTYFIGDRLGDKSDFDFVDGEALVRASRAAYKMAGIQDPISELDVAELYAPFTSSETQAYEALGFCKRGQAFALVEEGIGERDSRLPLNPSGGVQCANPIGATGLVRIAEIALQIMGLAGDHQIDGVRRGLATGAGGSGQFYTVAILGDKPL